MGKTYKDNKDKWKHKIKNNKPNKFNKGGKPKEPSDRGWENLPEGGNVGDTERYS